MDETKFLELFTKHRPVQNGQELRWLIRQVERTNPQTILEIGVERGGSFKIWEQVLPVGGRLIGVDIQHVQTEIDISKSDRNVILLVLDSHNPQTVDVVKQELNGRPVDFLYIDGDHSYDGCKSDFEMFSPLVRQGGLVGFHDVGTEVNNVGRFFKELQGEKEQVNLNGQGCGVWWKH